MYDAEAMILCFRSPGASFDSAQGKSKISTDDWYCVRSWTYLLLNGFPVEYGVLDLPE